MPVNHLAEAVHRFDEWYGVYPLLVFSLRVYDRGDISGMLRPDKHNLKKGKDWGIWCDLGAYGMSTCTTHTHYVHHMHATTICYIMSYTEHPFPSYHQRYHDDDHHQALLGP